MKNRAANAHVRYDSNGWSYNSAYKHSTVSKNPEYTAVVATFLYNNIEPNEVVRFQRKRTYCLKLKRGMVTQPRASMLRRCLPFSSAPPGGGRGLAYKVTVSCVSRGNWLIWTGKQTLSWIWGGKKKKRCRQKNKKRGWERWVCFCTAYQTHTNQNLSCRDCSVEACVIRAHTLLYWQLSNI